MASGRRPPGTRRNGTPNSAEGAMLTKEENELLTRVGPGTPCGELLRRYWQPVALARELTEERPKQRVKVMGEELVLFRDARGRYGLVGEHCSHRGTSLYYGFL